MKSAKYTYIGLLLTGVLSACSGGGGGSDDSSAAAPTSAAVVITSGNASKVSAEAYDATVSTRDLGASGLGGGGITAAIVNSDATAFDLIAFTRQQISRLPDLQNQVVANTVLAPVIPATTESCELGGTLTLSGEVANTEALSPGDSITIEFNNCSDSFSLLGGKFTMRFNSIMDDPSAGSFGFDVSLTMVDFSVTAAGETSTGNGDIRLAIPNFNSIEVEVSISGNSLTLTNGNQTSTLTSYSITETLNEATGAYVTDSHGTLDSIEVGGSISFDTTVSFQGENSEYPFVGTLVISGANGSSTRMTALDSVNVRLEIDSDGDGAFEDTLERTWAELEQL